MSHLSSSQHAFWVKFMASLPNLESTDPVTLVSANLPGFDRKFYLDRYQDVGDAGQDPLRHYLVSGWKEGRDPSAGFSTIKYLIANPDVEAVGLNPLLHYPNYGLSEGRPAWPAEIVNQKNNSASTDQLQVDLVIIRDRISRLQSLLSGLEEEAAKK